MTTEELFGKMQTLVLDSEQRISKRIDTVENKLTERISAVENKLTEEIRTVDMKVEVVNKRTETIGKELHRSIKDLSEFFQEISVMLDKIKREFTYKIHQIEEFVGFSASS